MYTEADVTRLGDAATEMISEHAEQCLRKHAKNRQISGAALCLLRMLRVIVALQL
jgi:hypothetical protein